jgi:hypothetical protein|tara:strand:+ start:7113 stop:7916 length:804 start_codon:yes stop_codon:yes gene_type:complete
MELKEEIMLEIRKMYGEQGYEGLDNWNSVRNPNAWTDLNIKKQKKKEMYEALQASRGLNLFVEKTFQENIDLVKKEMNLPFDDREQFRLDLLSTAMKFGSKDELCVLDKVDTVYELGFRWPRLLKHYQQAGKKVIGYDVVKLNVLIGQYLGYDCQFHDLSSDEPLFFEENSLIVAYDVFEHLPDPHNAIKKIYDAMEENSFFHIEVPTEHQANLSLGHFYAFKNGELRRAMENFDKGRSKFEILSSNLYSPQTVSTLVPQSILCTKN